MHTLTFHPLTQPTLGSPHSPPRPPPPAHLHTVAKPLLASPPPPPLPQLCSHPLQEFVLKLMWFGAVFYRCVTWGGGGRGGGRGRGREGVVALHPVASLEPQVRGATCLGGGDLVLASGVETSC